MREKIESIFEKYDVKFNNLFTKQAVVNEIFKLITEQLREKQNDLLDI